MCHLLLLMPALGLPLFWLLPMGEAVPIYGVIVGTSAVLYAMAVAAMHRPAITGLESLIGREGRVRAVQDGVTYVQVGSESWRARAAERNLIDGDLVQVVAVNGLILTVRRISDPTKGGIASASCVA